MQDLASHETGILQIEYRLGHVGDLAHSLHGMQCGQRAMRFRGVHGRLDDARRHRVHANVARGVLDRKATRCRGQATLGQ
ncbi:hypothetical protein G6F22_021081 [Rhizopus arrhizus]|uniref:Uncharacterized protein n=1 Tax=Rhizopus delemar TaxID=936053 RepID=A0A9P6XMZ1_9FUNG|nr:hypothetical protein G6F22_021081 [Rhizopus arrhizus]KAG1526334.1 hypothetical protein G6F50_018392 [Rhizopus delemar]